MNPKPLSSLNHFTVPVAIQPVLRCCSVLRSEEDSRLPDAPTTCWHDPALTARNLPTRSTPIRDRPVNAAVPEVPPWVHDRSQQRRGLGRDEHRRTRGRPGLPEDPRRDGRPGVRDHRDRPPPGPGDGPPLPRPPAGG